MSRNLVWNKGKVTALDRAKLLRHDASTIWLTGLPGAGKSTIAFELERRLHDRGHACFVLDGDNVRHGLNRDLGFSPEHRRENIRRIAEVARLFNEAGVMMITAFISPYRDDREMAREIIGVGQFVEVYLAADIAVCERRDPKGHYRKARAGEITGFTGISAPYEPPESPALTIDSGRLSLEDCVGKLLQVILPRLRAGAVA